MNLTDKRKKQELQGQFGRVGDPGAVQLHGSRHQGVAELHSGSQNQSAADQAVQMVQEQPNGGYQSQWQDQMNDVMQQILDRKPFSYDMNADALYQQYKDQYTQQGRLAMQDTMGQAAKLTGGYGNSYAQTAGQQVYQGYMQQLGDKIPELYNLALNKYQMEGQELMDRFSTLGAMEDRDYGRYQDNREWEYQMGRDQLSDQRYDQEWQYQQDRDALADQRYQDELAYGRGQDSYDRQRDAYVQLMELIVTTGYQPTAEEMAAAGMSEAQAKAWLGYYNGSQGGVSSSSSNPGSTRNPGNGVKADNGSLSVEQVKALQQALGVAADGKYGPKTKSAAGGLSAEEAYKKYVGNPGSAGDSNGFTGTTYSEACAYLKANGKSVSGLMTSSEWARHKNGNNSAGGEHEASSYAEYLAAYVYGMMN